MDKKPLDEKESLQKPDLTTLEAEIAALKKQEKLLIETQKRKEKAAQKKAEKIEDFNDLKHKLAEHIDTIGKVDQTEYDVKVPKNLVPDTSMSKVVANITNAERMRRLSDIKDASAKGFLPKIAPVAPTPAPKPFNIESANKEASVWKSNRNPEIDVQTKPSETTASPTNINVQTEKVEAVKPEFIFDVKSDRWRNAKTGEYAVSPTKAANPLTSKLADSKLMQGSDIQKFAEFALARKEKAAQKESILNQKTDIANKGVSSDIQPAKTTTNPVNIQNAKDGVKKSNAEEKEDKQDQFDKIITILEKIEKNTSKGGADEKEEKKKDDKGSILGLLAGGLASLALKFTKIFKPLSAMLGKLLPLAASLVGGIKTAVVAMAKLLGSGLLKAGGVIKDVLAAAKDKIFAKSAEKAASVATKEGVKAAEKVAVAEGVTAAEKVAVKEGVKVAEKAAVGVGEKLAAKAAAKTVARNIPGVGLLAGIGFGASRLMKGDWKGAALEVASGVAGGSGIGIAAGVAGSAALYAYDKNNQDQAAPIVDKMNKTGILTESEAKVLRIADIEIPDGVEIVSDSSEKAKSQLSSEKPTNVSKVEPAPTSKIAQKMSQVEVSDDEKDEIDKMKENSAPTVINNITNNNSSSGSSGNANQGSRIYARNAESTLEKWLSSRYVWQ